MQKGLISVVIPTLNAARTLPTCLQALCRQTAFGDVEVLIVDGGSTDQTRPIAHEFGARIIENPWVLPERAKSLGLQNAQGEFGVFLDADEEIVRGDSFARKREMLGIEETVHNVMTAGLLRPDSEPLLTEYANRYGDPFSFFLYRLDGGDLLPAGRNRYRVVCETSNGVVFEVPLTEPMPLCDAGGHFFRLSRVRETEDLEDPTLASRLFTSMTADNRQFAILQGDFVRHHAATTFVSLARKIDWRVRNNTYITPDAKGGHAARAASQPESFRKRQYGFLPYALLVIPAVADAVRLAVRHRNPMMLAHAPLAVGTGVDIIFHRLARICGLRFHAKRYGRS